MGKSNISMAIFNSKLLNYQRIPEGNQWMHGILVPDSLTTHSSTKADTQAASAASAAWSAVQAPDGPEMEPAKLRSDQFNWLQKGLTAWPKIS